MSMSSAAPTRVPAESADRVWHTMTAEQVLRALGVDRGQGLTAAEAAARAQRFGPNRFGGGGRTPVAGVRPAVRRPDADRAAGRRGGQPVPAQGAGDRGGVDRADPVQRGPGAAAGGQRGGRGGRAAADDDRHRPVLRGGELTQIPAEQLVPGDVVAVEAGDVVPADGRLLRVATLEVAESALTGESLPVAKGIDPVPAADTPLGDRTGMVYMNTNVTRGSGQFVVTGIGMGTEVGTISGLLAAQDETTSPLTRQLARLTRQILWIAGAALVVSMALNLARGAEFTVVFAAAVAFAIGALPENLPAVVTILAYGTQTLA